MCKPGLVAQSVIQAVGWRFVDGFKGRAGPVATLVPEKGDRVSGPYLSYYQATTPGRWRCRKTEARRVSLQVEPQISSLGGQGRGFESREEFSEAFFSSIPR